jgi:proton-dependent oligopeptide transporter, POT family
MPSRFPGDTVEPREQNHPDTAGGKDLGDTTKQTLYANEKGNDYDVSEDQDADTPTDEERQTLRKVADKLPWSAFLVALVELCERFAYYGLTGPFQVREREREKFVKR